jgi:hypothetical protein
MPWNRWRLMDTVSTRSGQLQTELADRAWYQTDAYASSGHKSNHRSVVGMRIGPP